jgi:hypothetical protein
MAKFELLIKVGDSTNPDDPKKDALLPKDGDIIRIFKEGECKKHWDQMLERKRCTQQEYDDAQIAPGVFKHPWGRLDKKVHHIMVVEATWTDAQVAAMNRSEREDSGLIDSQGRTIFKMVRRNDFKVDFENLEKYDPVDKQYKKLSAKEKTDIKDKEKSLEPDYEKKINPTSIITKESIING